ncbi:TPA: hypothetical protein OL683_004752 [Citrobacter freundii]|uniref:hypothetical protein n=1 Tax=Citrobacter TaxID=544 RepID=UPI00122FF23B|nr:MULTISPECIES: hypothetical protein [Citrobacter]MED9849483.1 hypothetical protein [Escherichia coli]KAA3571459.1 hypothetical protein D1173_06785 [Citrobacter freundii]MBA8045082.1 hypothetical protein [Citrobacter freundii]QLO42272.1 hypothetical protein HV215_08975 [Citrobacter freundii]QLV40436.1 hypothetical protein HV198_08975 [Citrobacter freundii]
MSKLTPFLSVIEKKLNSSSRPEIELYQLIETANENDKKVILLAMIGKLIEQNKRLSSSPTKR